MAKTSAKLCKSKHIRSSASQESALITKTKSIIQSSYRIPKKRPVEVVTNQLPCTTDQNDSIVSDNQSKDLTCTVTTTKNTANVSFQNENISNRRSIPSSPNVSKKKNPSNTGSESETSYVQINQFRHFYANQEQKMNSITGSASTLFLGKDSSYPNELNSLMNPFYCGVCKCRMNSIKTSNSHYESKSHDRHITTWIKKTYTDNGLNPPVLKRFVTEITADTLAEYHCELCKLDLTSAKHALHHFNGKKHRQVVSRIAPKTGIGYFSVHGEWIHTGKVIDKKTGKETSYISVKTPMGLEPVVLQVGHNVFSVSELKVDSNQPPIKKSRVDVEVTKSTNSSCEADLTILEDFEKRKLTLDLQQIQSAAEPASNHQYLIPALRSEETSQTLQSPQEAIESNHCTICGINTTSKDQMFMHLKGARHTKKLKALGEPPTVFDGSTRTILESVGIKGPLDISMFRTPSGSYYCKLCNAAFADISLIRQHISSKKHCVAKNRMATESVLSDGNKEQ